MSIPVCKFFKISLCPQWVQRFRRLFVLFPRSGLLGASGIVFMLIMLSSLAGFSGGIPVTMLLVAALYFGQQVYDIIFVHDNVANFMHIVGGLCGTAFGYYSALHSRRRPAKAVKFSSTNGRRKH